MLVCMIYFPLYWLALAGSGLFQAVSRLAKQSGYTTATLETVKPQHRKQKNRNIGSRKTAILETAKPQYLTQKNRA